LGGWVDAARVARTGEVGAIESPALSIHVLAHTCMCVSIVRSHETINQSMTHPETPAKLSPTNAL
jgi:hypothetical protein